MAKIKRSRNGCLSCKERRRKCDEGKPVCSNCKNAGRSCSYGLRLSFDVDDSRHSTFMTMSEKGQVKYGFRGRPRLQKNKASENGALKAAVFQAEVLAEPQVAAEAKTVEMPVEMPGEMPLKMPVNLPVETAVATAVATDKPYPIETLPPPLSVPMKQETPSALSMETMTSASGSDMLEQDTFDFIHEGLDYLLSGLQNDLQKVVRMGDSSNAAAAPLSPSQVPNEAASPAIQDWKPHYLAASPSQEPVKEPPAAAQLSDSDETLVLRHFFNRLMPLLDSHPNNPWPELALKYCDSEIARSCFLSLSCMHLYGRKGGAEFYRTGMLHLNNTMIYLIKYVSNAKDGSVDSLSLSPSGASSDMENELIIDSIVGNLRKETVNQKRSSFFVILILIYVHILFSILESGRSVMSRVFMKLFATIAKEDIFQLVLEKIDQSQTFICILSWYDTVTAVSSPDCRTPFCNPKWFGDKRADVSLLTLNGCPGELFECLHKLCFFRLAMRERKYSSAELDRFYKQLKYDILNYRDYVSYRLHGYGDHTDHSVELKPEEEYEVRLKGAQCWAISMLVKLETLMGYLESEERITTLISEFISVYSSLDLQTPIVVQMVWPVFNIGSECRTELQKAALQKFVDVLNVNAQTGTLRTMGSLLGQSWRTGTKMEDILSGEEWLGSGAEYLPA